MNASKLSERDRRRLQGKMPKRRFGMSRKAQRLARVPLGRPLAFELARASVPKCPPDEVNSDRPEER